MLFKRPMENGCTSHRNGAQHKSRSPASSCLELLLFSVPGQLSNLLQTFPATSKLREPESERLTSAVLNGKVYAIGGLRAGIPEDGFRRSV